MKKLRLYVDTSVFGGLFDTESLKRVNTARQFFQSVNKGVYEGFVSLLTIEEIIKAPNPISEKLKDIISNYGFKILEETDESLELSNAYINNEAIPIKYRDDARHIAIGVYNEIDYIVSWNYRHMVNINVQRLINSANLKMGYSTIEIVSPEEVTGYGEVGI